MYILKELLETGHKVRVVSRSQEKGKALQQSFQKYAANIDIAEIDDQLAPNAYDKAIKGVDSVIHVASPFVMNAEDNEKDLYAPAVNMADNMLKAAANEPSVKRIVLTSSVAAVADPMGGGLFKETTYTPESWNPITKDTAEGPTLGYMMSKKLAEQSAWDFVSEKKPQFDLVTICPTLIAGAPIQHVTSMDKLNTSCAMIYSLFDAKEIPENQFPCVVDVSDVAKVHVQALHVKEAGGKRFIADGANFSWQEVLDAAREKYPELKDRMMKGKPGKTEIDLKKVTPIDKSATEKILGIKFKGWKETIVDETIGGLLKLEHDLNLKKGRAGQ